MEVRSLHREDPLEEGMAIHSSILAWRIPWTEEPGGLQSIGLQRVRQDWDDSAHMHTREECQGQNRGNVSITPRVRRRWPGVGEHQNKAAVPSGALGEGGWLINWDFPSSTFYQKGLSRVLFMREHREPTEKILGLRDEDESGRQWEAEIWASFLLDVSSKDKFDF